MLFRNNRFLNCFLILDLARRCFLQPFHLINIGKVFNDEIKKHNLANLLDIAQKHVYDCDCLLLV